MGQERDIGRLSGQGDSESVGLRIAQAIAWCLPRAKTDDPEGSLRSADLTPPNLFDNRVDAVSRLVSVRATALRQSGPREPEPVTGPAELSGGRLLFCNADESAWDGASEAESQGFFDIYDIAPRDTWVALHKDDVGGDVIVCWVPPVLHEAAQGGIAVSCVDCIGWLEETQSPVADAYRRHGLV